MTEVQTRVKQVADRQILGGRNLSYHNAPPYAFTVCAAPAEPVKNPLWPFLVAWKGARFRRAVRDNIAEPVRGPTRRNTMPEAAGIHKRKNAQNWGVGRMEGLNDGMNAPAV